MEKANAAILPSSQYAQLLQNVVTLPALNESNRDLRQNNESLKKEIEAVKAEFEEAVRTMEPLQQKLREAEERADKLSAELEALKGDNLRWRQRANQLIEKSHVSSIEFISITVNVRIPNWFGIWTLKLLSVSRSFKIWTSAFSLLENPECDL